jgi:AraC-like DNA-binding protein
MGKNFSHYINDLRIDFAIEELKENSTFRKYTIKAIANECGFKSAESFSKSFYKTYGIYPSFYLKQLQSTRK